MAVCNDAGSQKEAIRMDMKHVDFEKMLYPRYGFILTAPLRENRQIEHTPPTSFEQIRKHLGDAESDTRHLSSETTELIASCVTALLQTESLAQSRFPVQCWDLDSASERAILNEHARLLDVKAIISQTDETLYLLNSHRRDAYVIMVRDPTLVVECLRRKLVHSLDIAALFAKRGSPFKTLRHVEKHIRPTSHPLSRPRHREQGYRPNAADYTQYEEEIRQFLRLPRARAVFAYGGLLWRLAIEYVGVSRGVAGPAQLEFGKTYDLPGLGRLWDDYLSEDELNFLCGDYHIHSGKENRFTHASWWPSPRAWENCGIYPGYWSPACETWFQNRLLKIRNNEESVRPSSAWRTSIVFKRKTTSLTKNNKRLSAEFLTTVTNQFRHTTAPPLHV